MTSDDEYLASIRGPLGEQRFYPPGEHPATARYRAMLAQLEEHGFGESDAAEFVRGRLAEFEAAEERARRDYLAMRPKEGTR